MKKQLKDAGLSSSDDRISAAADAAVLVAGDFDKKVDAFYAALTNDGPALLVLFARWRNEAARSVLAMAQQRRSKARANEVMSSRTKLDLLAQPSTKASPAGQASCVQQDHCAIDRWMVRKASDAGGPIGFCPVGPCSWCPLASPHAESVPARLPL